MKAVECLGYSARFPFPQRAYVNCSRSKSLQRTIFSKAVTAGGGKEPWVLEEGLPEACGAGGSRIHPGSSGRVVLYDLC